MEKSAKRNGHADTAIKIDKTSKTATKARQLESWSDLIDVARFSISDVYNGKVNPAVNNSAMNSLGKLLHMVDIYQRQQRLGLNIKPPKILS